MFANDCKSGCWDARLVVIAIEMFTHISAFSGLRFYWGWFVMRWLTSSLISSCCLRTLHISLGGLPSSPLPPPLPHGHNKGSRATGEFLCIDFSGFKVQRNKDKRGGIPQPKYSYLSICFASQALQKVFLRELLFSNIWELVVSTQCRGKRDDKFLVQWR